MSADNYNLIQRYGDRYRLGMGFESDDHGPTVWIYYDSLEEAVVAANIDYTEYGVRIDMEDAS